jgi:glutamate carboxypeptidase
MQRPAIAAIARDLCDRLHAAREEILADIATLVGLESPSEDTDALGEAADWLEEWLAPAGKVSVSTVEDGRRLLLLETPGAPERASLILCHYDTVWPVGTLSSWPFEIKGNVATGPGVFDMKASVVCARHALIALQERDQACGGRLLITPDEEIGSEASNALIAELSAQSSAVLVLEPPLDDGRLKTRRKGHGHAKISITGRAAHAGVAPHDGINAIEEIARLVGQLREIAAAIPDSTVNVGRIGGGSALNVIAEHAEMDVDVRAWSNADMTSLMAAIGALRAEHPGANIETVCTVDRPPFERRPSTARLLQRCTQASAAVGLSVSEGGTGGGSDGSIAQAAGAAVLDGLGMRGAGPHTRQERIELPSLVPHAAVIGALVADLAMDPDV